MTSTWRIDNVLPVGAGSGYWAEFPGEPSSIQAARRGCSSWVVEATGDADVASKAALVVSELVANAVQAAPGSIFEVSASLTGTDVSVAVRNQGSVAMLPARPWVAPAEGAPRGRGLAIVHALASDVQVMDHGSALTVSVRLAPGTADVGPSTGSHGALRPSAPG